MGSKYDLSRKQNSAAESFLLGKLKRVKVKRTFMSSTCLPPMKMFVSTETRTQEYQYGFSYLMLCRDENDGGGLINFNNNKFFYIIIL